MNTFGHIYTLTSFGESHGPAIGGIIDGTPAGLLLDMDRLRAEVARRRPGSSPLTTPRKEDDAVEFLSGLMGVGDNPSDLLPFTAETKHAVTLGTPIGFMVRNADQRSADYNRLRYVYRPSHADYAWQQKYGVRDWRGGGRSSGRETLARVVAGAVARQALERQGVEITSRLVSIGSTSDPAQFDAEVLKARSEGDSVGGVVECVCTGVPAGWGEPTFGKLQQMMASAMLSIGAVKGFEYGMGFAGAQRRGSEMADCFCPAVNGDNGDNDNGGITTMSNHSGGIQGGISNGQPIVMRVAFKPTATLCRELPTVNASGEAVTLRVGGRHDPCIALRGRFVVEAMAAMVLLDAYLLSQASSPLAL